MQEQTRKRKTNGRKEKKNWEIQKKKRLKTKPVIGKGNHGQTIKSNKMKQEKRGVTGSGQRKNERDNMCPHSDPQKPKLPH